MPRPGKGDSNITGNINFAANFYQLRAASVDARAKAFVTLHCANKLMKGGNFYLFFFHVFLVKKNNYHSD